MIKTDVIKKIRYTSETAISVVVRAIKSPLTETTARGSKVFSILDVLTMVSLVSPRASTMLMIL